MADAAPLHVVVDDDTETIHVDPETGRFIASAASWPTMPGIYCLKFPDGRLYIGSSFNVRARIFEHVGRMRDGKHRNPRLQRGWNKFRAIVAYPILVCREDDLIFYEQICIDGFHPGLNLSPVAGRVVWSQESREKLSRANKGRKHTAETREKMSLAQKGIRRAPQSAETIHKRSLTLLGNKHRLGTKQSEKEKARISEFMRGNTYRLGVKLSDEHKAAITNSLKGNKRTLGRVRPDEEREQIRQKMKQIWARRRAEQAAHVAT